MLVLLLPGVYVLLVALFWRGCGGRRAAFIGAALVFAALLLALTEGLSRTVGLSATSVAVSWLALMAVLALIVWRWRPGGHPPAAFQLERSEWGMLALLGVFLGLLTVIALAAPPNTWDSLTYHMSRVAHWIQNGSVDFYPTAVTRQLYQHPLAEYGILQLQLLAGGDQFANLVQLAAYALGLASVSLITRELGGTKRAQIVSAVLFATLPMAILQATSTSTDLVIALWVMVFVWFCLRAVRSGLTWPIALGAAMALGLALTAKGTAYVFVMPFALWLAVAAILRQSVRALAYGAVMVGVALVFPLAHLARNVADSGSPLGSDGPLYANQIMGPDVLVSNLGRNLALELTPPEPFDSLLGVSAALNQGLGALHGWLGLDVSDQRTTWEDGIMRPPLIHEAHMGATIFVLLGGLALVIYGVRWRRLATRTRTLYLLLMLMTFVLFSLALRYMPWHARLHLPILALAVSFVAIVLTGGLPRRACAALLMLVVVAALPPLLANDSRPLVGARSVLTIDRWTQLFVNGPQSQAGFISALDALGDCEDVGLLFTPGSPEYPLWVGASMRGRTIRFMHLVGANAGLTPCAIIADIALQPVPDVPGYTLVESTPPLGIYVPNG